MNILLVAFVFGIIFPVYFNCMESNNGSDKRLCQEQAWYIALASNFITGVIILALCLFGELIRRNVPAVALLSSLSGVGFTYLALAQYLPIAASPIVSFVPFAIVMTGYFSGSKDYQKCQYHIYIFVFFFVKLKLVHFLLQLWLS